MSLLAAVQPDRAPNGDFGGRSFQGVAGPPTGLRTTAPGFPGAPNVPGSQLGIPATLRDTPGRRSDATVQYTCVVPMGGPLEMAETAALKAGSLAFVYNDTGLESRGRLGPDKMTRLVSFDHLASHVTGARQPQGLTEAQIARAQTVKRERAYPDAVQVIEAKSNFQHLPLGDRRDAQYLAFPRNVRDAAGLASWLKTPFLMWKALPFPAALANNRDLLTMDNMPLVPWDEWQDAVVAEDGQVRLVPMRLDELGMQGVPRDPLKDLLAMQGDDVTLLAGADVMVDPEPAQFRSNVAKARTGQLVVEEYADREEQDANRAYRMLIYNPLLDEIEGSDVHVYKPHGIVIYKYSTQGSDTPAEQALDAMQNGIFNLCVMGHTLSASFTEFATAARNSSKRQRRLVTLPRDIMYIVVVARLNLNSMGTPDAARGTACFDHIRYERTTSEEFNAKMRYRMSISKADSFLRENEVILGAWRLGSVIDNAASRMMPAGSPHSFSSLASNGVTLSVGINWVSSFELHERYWVPHNSLDFAEDDRGSPAVAGDPQYGAVRDAELRRRMVAFTAEIRRIREAEEAIRNPPPSAAARAARASRPGASGASSGGASTSAFAAASAAEAGGSAKPPGVARATSGPGEPTRSFSSGGGSVYSEAS